MSSSLELQTLFLVSISCYKINNLGCDLTNQHLSVLIADHKGGALSERVQLVERVFENNPCAFVRYSI